MSTPTTNYGFIKAAEGEQYDVDITNNNLDGIDTQLKARTDFDDKAPLGLVYQCHITGSSGAVLDAIIHNVPTFTFKANRKYRVIWDFSYLMSGNSDSLYYVSINLAPTADAASSLANCTPLEGRTKFVQVFAGASTGHTGPITAYHQQGSTNNTTQLKFRVQRVYGDDSITIVANGNERAVYSIYDDGAFAGTVNGTTWTAN